MSEDSTSWHLRKELSIGTIISLLLLGAGSVTAFNKVTNDLEHKADKEQVTRVVAKQEELASDINDIKSMQREILQEQRKMLRELRD